MDSQGRDKSENNSRKNGVRKTLLNVEEQKHPREPKGTDQK